MLPFDEVGSGPVIVLLHAGIADRSMWREQLAPLADAGHRVLALDMPGFGEAAPTAGPQAPWNDVLESLAELGVERAALVGNSFGGAVALRIALVAPVVVSALALISAPSPAAAGPSPQLQAAWDAEEAALERDDIDSAVQAVVNAWTLPDAPQALRDRIAAMQRRIFILGSAASDYSEAPDPFESHPEGLASITAPALVAAGAHDMPDFIEGAEQMAAALPNARHALIAKAGHLAPLETPGPFRHLLLDFLAEQAQAA